MRRYEQLPNANPQDFYWTLKQLVNRRDALVKTKSMLMRQFHDQIQYSYPNYKKFFHEIECETSLTFYEAYPSASTLEHITIEELAEFLRKPSHNCCSTKKAEQILNKIEEDAVKKRDYQYGRDFIVKSIVRHLRYQCEELKKIESVMEKMLRDTPYQLETLPGVHTVTACALISHIGENERFSNANKLASYARVAPICFSSARKGRSTQSNHAGLFRLQKKEGKTKIQALLCIMRRLINIIYSMMKHKSAYQIPLKREECQATA